MSSGRQAHVNLTRVKSDLVLVAGSRDQKFLGLAESMTHLANGVPGAVSGGITHGTVPSSGKEAGEEGVSVKLHAECRVVQNCGHAVHLERPEAVVHLLQSLLVDDNVESNK